MIYTVQEFCRYVSRDVNGFIDFMAEEKSRVMGSMEKMQLSESYSQVSKMLSMAIRHNPNVADVQICSMANMLLEYKLPSASAWCDLVIIGQSADKRPEVMVVELKNYNKKDIDAPGPCEGLIIHNGMERQHPADQVKGYTEYCKYFHSAVQEDKAKVTGLVYFTQDTNVAPYNQFPNDALTAEYPCYNAADSVALANHIAETIVDAYPSFAAKFVNGYYKQNRNVLLQVAESLKGNGSARPFVLLDEQRTGFHQVMEILKERVHDKKKQVIIVQGPPGSGKSAVAINIWVEAVSRFAKEKTCGNIVYVTTSGSQKDNWNKIFDNYGDNYNAHQLTVTSNSFNPGLNGSKLASVVPLLQKTNPNYVVKAKNKCGYAANPQEYKGITQCMIDNGECAGYRDNLHFISVVDEAHALINPVKKDYSSNKSSGWYVGVGPQAYHIIRESQNSIFFTDDKQSFRDNETTSIADIEKFASEAGASVVKVDLSGLQFRCAGSKEYVDWIDHLFTDQPLHNAALWKDKFKLKIVNFPSDLDAELNKKILSGDKSVRLASSYTREWVSHDLDASHSNSIDHGGDVPYDFELEDKGDDIYRKYWNNPTAYDIFVQASTGKMAQDPLCEVGCPYVIRGFDYNYIGLLWLEDIVYRKEKGGWIIQHKYACETATGCAKSSATKEMKDYFTTKKGIGLVRGAFDKDACCYPINDDRFPMSAKYAATVAQAYRILMTRALKGIFIYIKDDETREYVERLLK